MSRGGGIDKLVVGILVTTTLLAGSILASLHAKADNESNNAPSTNVVDDVTIIIPTSCTLSGNVASGDEHTATVLPGSYAHEIGTTDLTAKCNDFGGFSIYAVGYTGNTEGTTTMVGANTNSTIITGTQTSGDTSNWAMKLTKVENPESGDPITYNPDILTITSNYDDTYYNVPSTFTKVVEYKDSTPNTSSATDQTLGAHIETTYAAYVSGTQPADTYNGKVKYVLVHPASIDSVSTNAVTLAFQTYPNSDMYFADGTTTNTMKLYQTCESGTINTYEFNTSLTGVTNDLRYYVEGEVFNDDYIPYHYDYIFVNTNYGVPILGFGYHQTTSGYNDRDGFAYLPTPLQIPAYGIDYSAGWYFGNSDNPTAYVPVDAPTITITGGNDAEDTDFLSWLSDNTTVATPITVPTNCTFVVGEGEYKTPVGYKGAWDFPQGNETETLPFDGNGDEFISLLLSQFGDDISLGQTIPIYASLTQTMQSVSAWKNTLNIGDEITATDDRDGKSYTVAKLRDGNIWMTQNLDFDIVDGGAALDSTNTDVPSNWADAGNLTNTYATNTTTWNNSNTTPESYDPGTLYWNGIVVGNQANCEASGGTWYDKYGGYCEGCDATSSTGNSHYKLGNYYNWTAAVAMSDSSNYTIGGTDVDQSICPAGWRLPTYSSNKSFDNLVNQANLTAGTTGNIHTNPNWFVYGGGWYGSLISVGDGGHYWSSVVYDSDNSYYLSFGAGADLYAQNDDGRNSGFSVRCVSR